MIIDRILDRYDGDAYDPKEFYDDMMSYEEGTDYKISRAMDSGEEEDIRRELCAYIDDAQYNPKIKDFINSVAWLEPDDGRDYSKEIDILGESKKYTCSMAKKKESLRKKNEDRRCKVKVHETRYNRAFIPGEPIGVFAPNGRKLITGYGLGGGGEFSEDGDYGCIVFPKVTNLELIDTVYTLKGMESGFTDTVRFVDDQVWTPEDVIDEYKNLHYKTPRGFMTDTVSLRSDECDVVWFEHADTATEPGTSVVRIGGKPYDTCVMDGKTWLADDLSINDGGDGIIEYKGTTYYTWDAAQRVCPDGWRVPSRSEINSLYDYVGSSSRAGKALRSRNYNGSDTYGLNLVPKGIIIGDDTSPRNYGDYAYLWTSSMSGSKGCGWGTNTETASAYFNSDPRDYYCTVRLVKD